jgi:protein-tyrosine phosphatase
MRTTSSASTTSTAVRSGVMDGVRGDRKQVLFVCTANICRSPMAEAILNALASDMGVLVEARSAGTAALVGEPIAPHAEAALEEVGVYGIGHRARQVDAAMLEEADLVLAMTPQHAATLRRLSPDSAGRVHTLVGYAYGVPGGEGIADPYGQSMAVHRASVRRILKCVQRMVSQLRS